jgi:hypothetical protein
MCLRTAAGGPRGAHALAARCAARSAGFTVDLWEEGRASDLLRGPDIVTSRTPLHVTRLGRAVCGAS